MTPKEVVRRAAEVHARMQMASDEQRECAAELAQLDGEPVYDAATIREALRRLCERRGVVLAERERALFVALTDGDPEQRGPWSRRDVTRADDGVTGSVAIECDAIIREAQP